MRYQATVYIEDEHGDPISILMDNIVIEADNIQKGEKAIIEQYWPNDLSNRGFTPSVAIEKH